MAYTVVINVKVGTPVSDACPEHQFFDNNCPH